MTFAIYRTHRKGKPLTVAELLINRWDAPNATQAVVTYLKANPHYRHTNDTLVAEPVKERKTA